MRIQLSENDPDYPAMVLANYMFGGSITARMPNRIRNREGLSYGASSRFTAPAEGDAALFSATVSLQPGEHAQSGSQLRRRAEEDAARRLHAAEVAEAKRAYADARKVAAPRRPRC